jgi:hypothetical protein
LRTVIEGIGESRYYENDDEFKQNKTKQTREEIKQNVEKAKRNIS